MKVTIDQYWHNVSQKMLDGEPEFPLLSKLCVAMLCIPNGNAESEQIFSKLSLAKNKFRSRMTSDTLNGVLTVNFNLKGNRYAFVPSPPMLVKVRHPRQMEVKLIIFKSSLVVLFII